MSEQAEIEVEREAGEETETITVTVEGTFDHFGSYNPNERGWHLADWDVIEPKGFVLTPAESERAVQALYDQFNGR